MLVEILGRELNAEEMIKLDLHIRNKVSGDWHDTLLDSIEHREADLRAEARRFTKPRPEPTSGPSASFR